MRGLTVTARLCAWKAASWLLAVGLTPAGAGDASGNGIPSRRGRRRRGRARDLGRPPVLARADGHLCPRRAADGPRPGRRACGRARSATVTLVVVGVVALVTIVWAFLEIDPLEVHGHEPPGLRPPRPGVDPRADCAARAGAGHHAPPDALRPPFRRRQARRSTPPARPAARSSSRPCSSPRTSARCWTPPSGRARGSTTTACRRVLAERSSRRRGAMVVPKQGRRAVFVAGGYGRD